jgi:hypothetical protein
MVLDTLKETLALCMGKERENHINELKPTSWLKRSLLR